MELNIRFGGFYHSLHSEIVDYVIECYFEDEITNENFYDTIDYKKTYEDYCKNYVKYFFNFVEEVEGIKLTIKQNNIEMWSPREYNFSTDVIVLKNVSNSTIKNLTILFDRYLEDKAFKELIKDKTSSRDGYIPFYAYEEILNKEKLDISLDFILEFLANKFNDEEETLHHKISENLSLFFV